MLKRLKEIFAATCDKWECTLLEFNGEVDHIHALIDLNPKIAPSTRRQKFLPTPNRTYSNQLKAV